MSPAPSLCQSLGFFSLPRCCFSRCSQRGLQGAQVVASDLHDLHTMHISDVLAKQQKKPGIYLKKRSNLSDCQTGGTLALLFLLPLHFSLRTRDRKLREELEEDHHGPANTAEASRSL